MTLWLDNQLSPALARWANAALGVEWLPIRDRGLQRAGDAEIFQAARTAGAGVMTKDVDFAELVRHHGPPPQIVLLCCGNTSNAHLQRLLARAWPTIQAMLDRGEPLVEVGDPPQ